MRTTLALLGLLTLPCLAFQTPAPKPADEPAARAIAELNAAFVKAYNAGDAKTLAALFTQNALVLTEDGARIEGRPQIEAAFAALFAAEPGARITLETASLRLLGPETALEEGTALVTGSGPNARPEPSRYTATYVKQNGRWLHAYVRDEPVTPQAPREHLEPLAWLVGDWVHESTDAVVFTSCKWDDEHDGNYLLRSFTIQIEGRPVLKGTQRIGWDPLTKQVKSWIFDAHGGYSEGLWSRDGDQWVVKSTGVKPDGRVASATQLVTPLSKDRISWQSVDRTEGGAAVPDIDEVILVRKPPGPGK